MLPPKRLFLLDTLRGLAAIAVVVVHWQFWGSDSNRFEPVGGWSVYRAFCESVLFFFYQCGGAAVGLCFTLSGFVFFWLFRDSVRSRAIGPWQFFVGRFSRLYPLHLATLTLVAIGQFLYAPMNHGFGWNSPINSASNFVEQLLIFPLWAPSHAIEFNLPVWSLVVEALLYVVFFVLARRVRLGLFWAVLMVVVGRVVGVYSKDIGYGLTSFFLGGVAYTVFERVSSSHGERALRVVVVTSWAFVFIFGSGLLNLSAGPLWFLDRLFATYFLFPLTVLYLALFESRRGPCGARLAWLGDATYSLYLLGFPLMLGIALCLRAAGYSFDVVRSPLALLIFLAVAIPIALASHRYFERPVQCWLQGRLLGRTVARAGNDRTPARGD